MKKGITVVGLGPGNAAHLSVETFEVLQKGAQVILRTAVHPSVSELKKAGIKFTSCDDFYETGASFDEVYKKIVEFVLDEGARQEVIYAVPGSPLVAERTVVMLREQAKARSLPLKILPAMSFLDLAYVELELDPISGLRIIDSLDFEALADAGKYPLMITQVYSQLIASDIKINLMEVLSDEAQLYFLRNLGLPDEVCLPIKLYELDRQPHIDHLTSVFIPAQEQTVFAPVNALVKEQEIFETDDDDLIYGYSDDEDCLYNTDIMPLVSVIKRLREPGGCPWDREQTHKSIRSNLVEEVYELLEAIDNNDIDGIQEELGDVLMQVVLHTQIASEAKWFYLQDVIDEVTEKLIRRHPHVFASRLVKDSDEVIKNWDAIKLEEKKERTQVLDGVPSGLPTLLRAYKLHSKAAKVGFDWPDNESVWSKVLEELHELEEAVKGGRLKEMEHELGDLLFALAGYAKHIGLEPEVALNSANNRFIRRFTFVEKKVRVSKRKWQDFSLDKLNVFWEQAKEFEKNR